MEFFQKVVFSLTIFHIILQTHGSALELSSISAGKSLDVDNTREYLYWIQNKITMLQSYLYRVKIKYPENPASQPALVLSAVSMQNATEANNTTTPSENLTSSSQPSNFCKEKGNGYYSQPGNCHQYISCSETFETSGNNCAPCSLGSAPRGFECCNGRLCWKPTSANEGVCTWCKKSCECYPPYG
ncbi:unnamed protein product [Orchesella dallaii]|uniref:Uncharacterized protein n=1 Tax=Orchesella dallaii TaxID=48710 RepID=A0ABP1S066_9HEXA